jgi:hypothetical protein
MKTLLCASLFISASVMACPDLSGKWTSCRSTTDPSWIIENAILTNLKTSPLELNIVTENPYSNEVFVVDGLERKTSSPSPYGEAVKSYTAECSGDSITIDTRVTLGGQPFAAIRTIMTLEGGRLIQEMSGSVGANKDFKDKMICE